ncbi:hypothetical protein V8E53_015467, partial [Lactarius tabidus]
MLLVVGNGHKFVFSPKASIAEGGQPPLKPNFPQGTVIDTVLTRSVELDFYLCSHQDTRHDKPAQYSVLLDDNNVMIDGIQSFSYALCHVSAHCTCTRLLHTERVRTRQELLQSASGPGTAHGRIGRRIDGPEPGCEWRWR